MTHRQKITIRCAHCRDLVKIDGDTVKAHKTLGHKYSPGEQIAVCLTCWRKYDIRESYIGVGRLYFQTTTVAP